MGRPVPLRADEIRRGFSERTSYMADIAESALADIAVEPKRSSIASSGASPLGVVFVIAPWNYPWLTSVNAVVPALLAGNSVILKMARRRRSSRNAMPRRSTRPGCPQASFSLCISTTSRWRA